MESSTPESSLSPEFNKRLKKRYNAEQRFKILGIGAIFIALAFLVFLMSTVIMNGHSAFMQTYVKLDFTLDKKYFTDEDLGKGDFQGIVKATLYGMFPDVTSRRDKRALTGMVSKGAAFNLMDMVREDPSLVGKEVSVWVPANDDVDMLMKGNIDMSQPEANRRIKDNQYGWIQTLEADERLQMLSLIHI